ncbi:MAG: FAD-dependent monooxygenase [Gemmatimonadetes bacterium]|nr:FAD-dependent monooxygenase [Gemmatimonadota bacterium]
MRINVIGGGPGGLFAALLLKKADPAQTVKVFERNRPDDTFGFGVVFSDATLEEVAEADPPTLRAIEERFYHWDGIHIHYQGELLQSTGHGFAGLSRRALLLLLQRRCREVGVGLHFEADVAAAHLDADLVIGADGINSTVRERFAETFEPAVDLRPNRFVWLGTTRPFPAFTFHFREDEHGLWRVHAYQYDASGKSTFIVEATERTWRRAGMDAASEEETARFLSRLFADELDGHPLIRNRSVWRQFPTVVNRRWSAGNVVLIGDAAHTAHFSVGSGTRLAMLDAIALARAMETATSGGTPGAGARPTATDLATALAAYEDVRRRPVESLQRAAHASLQWFEDTERYFRLEPTQFAFSLLTRSLRISHENLRERDPGFVDRVDRWVAREAEEQSGVSIAENEAALGIERVEPDELPAAAHAAPRPPPPPLFTPFRLRDLVLRNRVGVSAMCQYSAADGRIDDWHLVNLGSRAVGGAGLVMAEMTAIGRDGRISHGCAGLYMAEHVTVWRRLVGFVNRFTSARIGIQLGHAGRKGATRLDWEGPNEPLEDGGWPIVSASPIGFFEHSPVPVELDEAGMDALVRDFERSTEMAVEAGFDIVEIHMAHGYLLASFLSPLTNVRTDRYGGSLVNRLRFPLRVVSAVRELWPDEKPLSVRLSAVDWWPGGKEPEDAVEIARALKSHGCDIVDVSTGQTVPYQRPRYGRQFQTPFADRIRHEVGIATMAVGNISSFEDVNGIIAAGRADLCLMARAHLWDPYWTRHAAHALGYPLPWPPQYETLNTYTPRFGAAAGAYGPDATDE